MAARMMVGTAYTYAIDATIRPDRTLRRESKERPGQNQIIQFSHERRNLAERSVQED
jgi:hypothetical protein